MIGRARGTIVATRGGMLEAELPFVRAGDTVVIRGGGRDARARVVALQGTCATLAPWCALDGIARGDPVTADASAAFAALGTALLGRAMDASGAVLDGGPPIRSARMGRDPGALGVRARSSSTPASARSMGRSRSGAAHGSASSGRREPASRPSWRQSFAARTPTPPSSR